MLDRRNRLPTLLVPVVVALLLAALLAPAAGYAQNVQEMDVHVRAGAFEPDWLQAQTGPIRLAVTTQGGPYTLTIEPLVDPRPLPADSTTYVGFDAPAPGEFTLRLQERPESTATLAVTQPGF